MDVWLSRRFKTTGRTVSFQHLRRKLGTQRSEERISIDSQSNDVGWSWYLRRSRIVSHVTSWQSDDEWSVQHCTENATTLSTSHHGGESARSRSLRVPGSQFPHLLRSESGRRRCWWTNRMSFRYRARCSQLGYDLRQTRDGDRSCSSFDRSLSCALLLPSLRWCYFEQSDDTDPSMYTTVKAGFCHRRFGSKANEEDDNDNELEEVGKHHLRVRLWLESSEGHRPERAFAKYDLLIPNLV